MKKADIVVLWACFLCVNNSRLQEETFSGGCCHCVVAKCQQETPGSRFTRLKTFNQ